MCLQEKTKKMFKNPLVFFIIFAFGFFGGCQDPLFLSDQFEREPAQTEASRGRVSRREKATSLDEKTQEFPSRRLKAVLLDPNPLKDPLAFRTTDLGSTFPRGEKAIFTVPLNALNPAIQDKISFVKGTKEQSLVAESEQVAFTMQPEEPSFVEREAVFFFRAFRGGLF